MGIVKLYIMYWGVFTVIIIAWVAPKVLPNITKNETIFCAKLTKNDLFRIAIPILSRRHTGLFSEDL